ncbi:MULTISPECIES: helix-turn-helix transcriptional regulator [Protofrankia]|uniref:Helix-turn-helix domain protein n=1 Tax=Candidatus Protofrankia datiscae TaxID=2716812 RepID=F8AUR1_9ACTN|nr:MULTISPECIES: helix-turn-helix domain-containing protein [Protofrankia]AEH08105.1 helix-turn-helix domain protein [Candidatus Protofrankia datiscae]
MTPDSAAPGNAASDSTIPGNMIPGEVAPGEVIPGEMLLASDAATDSDVRQEARQEARQRELGRFLQAHRERVPGLPREQVAAASGLQPVWYTWLEQGRVQASEEVVEAVARTLRLDADARRHALALVGSPARTSPRQPQQPQQSLRPQRPPQLPQPRTVTRLLRPVLESWLTSPALLLDHRFDIIGWNDAYAALWTDPGLLDERRRNLVYLLITSRLLATTLHEWESVTKDLLAQFHGQFHDQFGDERDDERIREIFTLLEAERAELRPWWESQSAREFTTRTVTVNTATVGEIRLVLSLFRPMDDPDSGILLQTPVSHTDRTRIRQLIELPARWAGNDRTRGFYDQ